MRRIRRRTKDESGEVSHILKNYSGPSLSSLPREILVYILIRLTVKGILRCKRVCKTWCDLISGPEFSQFYFERGQVYPLIRFPALPSFLYLVHPEKDEFDLKLDMCDHTSSRLKCVCNVNVELHTKFEFPLANYSIVNSCNGLLCLSGPSVSDPLIVCNPVIGEFMKLPVLKTKQNVTRGYMNYGFGFGPKSKLYKVVILSNSWLGCDGKYVQGMMAEALTLGADSWKDIGFYVFKYFEKIPPTYLNGFLFWFSSVQPVSIFSFDIEKELFEPVEAPPVKNTSPHYSNVGMGVLGEELCMTAVGEETFSTVIVNVWLMKDCGGEKEWSKVYSLNLYSNLGRLCFGQYKPIKYLNDGALLMSQGHQNLFIYKDPRKNGFRCLKVPDFGRMEVIVHTPSFVSLKDALSGHNVKVLNVLKSRCSGYGISIVEEEVYDSVIWV